MPMPTRTRTLRLTAVLTLVVLSLTGFSTGRHHSRHGGGGGGCSSSHQDHDTSSSSGSGGSYGGPDDDSYSGGATSTGGGTTGGTHRRRPTHRATSTPSGSGTTPVDGTAKLVSCATARKPYATVQVSNPNTRTATFEAEVSYMADSETVLRTEYAKVSVPAKGVRTVRVPFDKNNIDLLDHCETDPRARLAD
ncbi:hypothetical protein ACIHEJ_19125 [Streptomyces sp. NPDC052301]|uniref:hypothetical protein n=1 Tax=Streptomyces sp. NPDC052301 TaxID=3365687 RepID=UPI0037D39C00